MDMIVQGIIAAATVLYLFTYLNIRRVLNYAFFIDIFVTCGLVYMFHGSYAGMMTGIIGGLIISMSLRVGRIFLGIEKPRFIRRKHALFPSLRWIRSR